MQLEFTASPEVRAAVESLGRTEDVRFSPSNRRLAIACFGRHRLALFGIEMAESASGTGVTLTSALELTSPVFKRPHGIDFIDEDTIVVANRAGDVALFKLPADAPGVRQLTLSPFQTWSAEELNLVESPGSVAVAYLDKDRCEILVCNNYAHTVTRHALDLTDAAALRSSEVLLRRWLHIPDGVAVSHDHEWIAISNHETHGVLLYENRSSLNETSAPDGILRGVAYPHGIRFSEDGRYLFVADAGSPSVLVFSRSGEGWRGVHRPDATIRVLDQATFLRGQTSPEEGGPKGIDISADSRVLVMTTEEQPLTFFDVPAMLDHGTGAARQLNGTADGAVPTDASEIDRELSIMELEVRAQRAERALAWMESTISWRMTAPVRRLRSLLPRRH